MSEMEEIQDQNQTQQPDEEEPQDLVLPVPAAASAGVALIDTVTIIPPDAQRCRRNSGHSGWRCKSLAADNNLQYCQTHYDSRKNNPPSKKNKKNKQKLITSDGPISQPIKLKIRRRRDLIVDAVVGGGGGVVGSGSSGCVSVAAASESGGDCCSEKRRRKSKKVDCPCCVEPRVSYSGQDCLKKEHFWVELGHEVDLNLHPAPVIATESVETAAVTHDLGGGGHEVSGGRNLEKIDVPPDELRCRRNDGVNWRCKNHWSSANDLRYCDKHYATRVIGLRRKSTPRKSAPSEWGLLTKSIANDLSAPRDLDNSKVELGHEGKIDEIDAGDGKIEIDPKIELVSEDKSVGDDAVEEDKVVESVEMKGIGEEEEGGGDLRNGGGEVANGNVQREEENQNEIVPMEENQNVIVPMEEMEIVQREEIVHGEENVVVQREEENVVVHEIKKKKKKKSKKRNRAEGGAGGGDVGARGKSESEVKDKKKKKRKREREIDSIFGVGTRVLNNAAPTNVTVVDCSVNGMAIQEDRSDNETAVHDATKDTYDSDGILEAFAEIGKKKTKIETPNFEPFAEVGKKKAKTETTKKFETAKKVETTKKMELKRCSGSGEVKPSSKSKERFIEMEKSLQHYKRKWLEMSVELEKKKMECVDVQGKLVDVESRKVVSDGEFKKYKRARRKREERAQQKITHLQEKIKLIEKDLEHGKRSAEDETEYWKKKFCDLETRLQKMENVNSTLKSSVESHKSEKAESEVQDVQHEVTTNDENQSDKSKLSKPDAEASGGMNGSCVAGLQIKKNISNWNGIDINKHPEAESSLPEHSALDISSNSGLVSSGGEKLEGKGGGWEERTSQHGSSSQNHLEMSKKPSVNGVSNCDGENVGQSVSKDSDTCSSDSKISREDDLDKLASKFKSRNIDKGITWEIETDMISSFEADPELCMRAVCALFRQQRSEEKVTADWLFHYSDALRGTTLALFLMDGDRRGDLKKSVEELDIFDAEGREDCKRLAKSYSKQLFRIYQTKEDPFFCPTSTTIP